MSQIHDIYTCKKVKSLEEILNLYDYHKKQIVELLKNNPSELINRLWTDYLNIDQTCQKTNELKCSSCDLLSHVMDDNQELNSPFKINSGESFILTENKMNKPYLKWSHKNIKGDFFTVKILVTWIIEDYLNKKNIPHSLHLYNAFICHHHGYLLYKIPTINNELCHFDRLIEFKYTKDIIYGILCQLTVLFNELSNLYFSLGNPATAVLLFDKTPCHYEYMYNNIRYKMVCEYTLKLADLSNSSIKVNNIVLFPQHDIMSLLNNHFNFNYYTVDNQSYIIKDDYLNPHFNSIKHALPVSIDFYLIILSMMNNDNFFNTVMENQECYDLWKSLWQGQESIIEQRLIDMNHDDLYRLLTTIKLHVDPYKFVFDNINVI